MSANELDSVIADNVHTVYASGSVQTADPFTKSVSRVGIVDASFLGAVASALKETLPAGADLPAELYRLGMIWGEQYYETLQQRMNAARMAGVKTPQDFLKEEFVEHLNGYFSYAGIGQFRITEGNKFYVVDVHNPLIYATDGSQLLTGILAGFFAGLFSRLGNKPLACLRLSHPESASRTRYVLSREAVVQEIRSHMEAGKTEQAILAEYGNGHMA